MAVYLLGATAATIFEFIVGKAMIRILGDLWWDYNEKPFNYKGIICLESTIAWGFYALAVVYFVQGEVNGMIDRVSKTWGIRMLIIVLLIVTVDYIVQLTKVFHVDIKEKRERFLAYVASRLGH